MLAQQSEKLLSSVLPSGFFTRAYPDAVILGCQAQPYVKRLLVWRAFFTDGLIGRHAAESSERLLLEEPFVILALRRGQAPLDGFGKAA